MVSQREKKSMINFWFTKAKPFKGKGQELYSRHQNPGEHWGVIRASLLCPQDQPKAPQMEAISPWTWWSLRMGLACVLPCSFWPVGMGTSLEAWMWEVVFMNRENWACLLELQPWVEAVKTWSWVEEYTGSLYLCHPCHQGLKSSLGIPRNEMGLVGGGSNLRGSMSKTKCVNGYFGRSHCGLMTLRATALTPCL